MLEGILSWQKESNGGSWRGFWSLCHETCWWMLLNMQHTAHRSIWWCCDSISQVKSLTWHLTHS